MDERTVETIRAYEELGEEYVNTIAGFRPVGIDEFIAELPPGARVLDVGCAGGRDSRIFVDAGFEVVGIDLVEEFLRVAREHVPEAVFCNSDVRWLLGRFEPLSFDAIWANAVLLHLAREDVPDTLHYLYHSLKRGGTIHVSVKEGEGQTETTDDFSSRKRHFTYFREDEIRRMMECAGFEIVDIYTFPDQAREGLSWVNCLARKWQF